MNGSYWNKLKQEREYAARKVAHDKTIIANAQIRVTIDGHHAGSAYTSSTTDQRHIDTANGCMDDAKRAHFLFDVFRSSYRETLERMNP